MLGRLFFVLIIGGLIVGPACGGAVADPAEDGAATGARSRSSPCACTPSSEPQDRKERVIGPGPDGV